MNDESIDFADSRMDVSFFLSSLSDFANFDEEDFFLEDFLLVSTEASTSALRRRKQQTLLSLTLPFVLEELHDQPP